MHREADRGVQHPDWEFLNSHDECVHEAAACRRAGRPLNYLVEADRSPRPGMPPIDDRRLAADGGAVGLVEGSCIARVGAIRPWATCSRSLSSGPRRTGNLRACQLLLGHTTLESTVAISASRSMTLWSCPSRPISDESRGGPAPPRSERVGWIVAVDRPPESRRSAERPCRLLLHAIANPESSRLFRLAASGVTAGQLSPTLVATT